MGDREGQNGEQDAGSAQSGQVLELDSTPQPHPKIRVDRARHGALRVPPRHTTSEAKLGLHSSSWPTLLYFLKLPVLLPFLQKRKLRSQTCPGFPNSALDPKST